jgi:PleD family two-component response regulator
MHIAERVRTAIKALCIPTGSGTVTPSVSVGVFAVPTHVESITAALHIAGPSLAKAKRAGKDMVAN